MRIARVLHLGARLPEPVLALERDGALYAVAELERAFGVRIPAAQRDRSDFHARVIALGGAGLDALDDRLLAGDRPTLARIEPKDVAWLPPCDPERALHFQLGPYDGGDAEEPEHWISSPRALLGHEATLVFPAEEEAPDFELGVAAILGEDLRHASPRQAERAVLGYAILNGWTGRDEERRARAGGAGLAGARAVGTQLGPVLVTADEVGDVARLRAQVRFGEETFACSNVGKWPIPLARAVAFLSRRHELRAGDVVGLGRLGGGSAASHGRQLAYDSSVEVTVERLGRLVGRPVRGERANGP